MDFLNIYEGTTLVATNSGHQLPDPITINSGEAYLIWCTNEVVTYEGWRLYYEIDNVGHPEYDIDRSVDIYPNPASDQLHVVYESSLDDRVHIRMISLTGQVVREEVCQGPAGKYHTMLNVTETPAGIYFLEFESSRSKVVRKVVLN